MAEDKHGSRINIRRKSEQGTDLLDIFHDITDVAGTDVKALRSGNGILRSNHGILDVKQKISAAGGSRCESGLLIEGQPFLAVGTEDEHHGSLCDEWLMITEIRELLFFRLIRDIEDCVEKLTAG